MALNQRKRKRFAFLLLGGLALFLATVALLASVFVEPALRKKLHTLIIDGSDSLYTYKLGDMHVNFFGGSVGIHDLQVSIDSNRYNRMKEAGELPSLIMDLRLDQAHIHGVGIFALLFKKEILIDEISSSKADIVLNRFTKSKEEGTTATRKNKLPLWKAIQPRLKDVVVKRIKLNGIKLLYKNEQGAEGKLQFDRCDALFQNIHIDSIATTDTSRLDYVENFSFQLEGLKFRTSDSTYKLKAKGISYNSASRLLEVDSFKLQPTLKSDQRNNSLQKSWYTATFDKVSFLGLRLDRYLRFNHAEADSVVFQNPSLAVYQDKTALKSYTSKIGKYPHQLLMKAATLIRIQKFIARNMQVAVTERDENGGEEATINITDINMRVSNIVNDPALVRQNPVATAEAEGKLIGSPLTAVFRFYLDSTEGRFDVNGHIGAVTASQINPISTRLANIEVPSVNILGIDFFVRGEDYEATSNVRMQYNNLSLIFRKHNDETGANSTRKFLTKILNRYAINPANAAGPGERKVDGVRVARLTTQTFFGVIWKAVFEGMQRIMLKSGQLS